MSRNDVSFGGPENKRLHFDHISPPPKKNFDFGGILMEIKKFSLQKGLDIAGCKRKRPLFIKLCFWKLMLNKQLNLPESKYVTGF